MGKKKKNKSRRKRPGRVVRTSNFSRDTLASVILISESTDDDGLYTVIKNIVEEQTHKKIDLIVSSFREEEDCKEIMERASKLHLDVRWIFHKPDNNFI